MALGFLVVFWHITCVLLILSYRVSKLLWTYCWWKKSGQAVLRLVVHPFIPSSFTKRFFTSQVVVFSPDFVTPSTVCQDAIKTTDLDTWSCRVFHLQKVNGFFQTTWQQDDPQETGRHITSNEPLRMIPPKHWTIPEQPNLKYFDIANVKKSNQNKDSEIMTHLPLSKQKTHPSS